MMAASAPSSRRQLQKSKKGGSTMASVGAFVLQKNRYVVFGAALFCLGSFSFFPILVMESLSTNKIKRAPVSPDRLIEKHVEHMSQNQHQQILKEDSAAAKEQDLAKTSKDTKKVSDRVVVIPSLTELKQDTEFRDLPVARGVSGRTLSQTPALVGAKRGHIECEINVDSLAYWNDPQGSRDAEFQSPFRVADPNQFYITFNPDPGGWNNIRMSMEIIFIIAAATGRTLVLPPKRPLYLLHHAKKGESRHRGFADFYPIHTVEFQKRVKVITMEEFIQREGTGPNARFPVPEEKKAHVLKAAVQCDNKPQEDGEGACDALYEYLSEIGSIPNISASDDCLVFDDRAFHEDEPSDETKEYVAAHCGKRRAVYWGATDKATLAHESVVIHINAAVRHTRLLAHFYSFVFFTNPAIDNYYKRFVRDFLHYHDTIYCAAGKIVKALQAEAAARGFQADDASGAGGFSSMHVRRGELQYKRVKIPAKEWYENTKEVWLPKEILYVATDERNKTFFDDIAAHHELRFLDDYWDFAGLGDLDGNYMGMIDTIVASRGRAFAGTWFSTFSGFINRMRGYHGMSMMDSWYSFLEKKEGVHQWVVIDDSRFAFEWPDGWIGIDADVWPNKDKF